jgi:hypothetical protein
MNSGKIKKMLENQIFDLAESKVVEWIFRHYDITFTILQLKGKFRLSYGFVFRVQQLL